VDDAAEVATSELHGQPLPDTADLQAPRVRDLDQKPATDAVSSETLGEFEARLVELENELTGLASQPQTADPVAPEVYQRLHDVERTLEALQSSPPSMPEESLAAIEERFATLHAAYNALEERLPQVQQPTATETLAEMETRLAKLESELSDIEAQSARPEPVSPEVYQRLHEVEQTLAGLEEIRPAVSEDTLEDLEGRFSALSGQYAELEARLPEEEQLLRRLEVLEARASVAAPVDAASGSELAELQSEIQALRALGTQTPDALAAYESRFASLESAIAALETREPQVIVQSPAEYTQRLAELERDLALLEQDRSAAAVPSPEVLARLDAMERKLAAVENAAPTMVDGPVTLIEERLSALQAQYEAIEERLPAAGHTPAAVPALETTPWLPDQLAGPPDFDRYQIGAGDLLEFQSFDDTTLNREVVVRYDGYVSLPLIPDIMVAGSTRQQAEDMVRQAYASVFRQPQLSLMVRTAGSKTFTVVGDISLPGIYPYAQSITLIDAISQAGGLRNRSTSASGGGGFVGITGQLTKAHIIRFVNGERQVLTYDLRGLGQPGNHSAHAPVYYGDLIYIPEGVNLVYVLGESGNRVIELTEGMTLLQLLSLSGGFNASTAQLRNVVLMRQTDEEKSVILLLNLRRMLRTGEDFKLQPGDIVYIPQKRLVRIEEFVRRFTGSISPFFNLYTSAVDAYYAKDLVDVVLQQGDTNGTLELLTTIENAGTSGRNIIDLFGNGTP